MKPGDLVQVRKGSPGQGDIGVVIERVWNLGGDTNFAVMFPYGIRNCCALGLKRIEENQGRVVSDETR